MVEIVLLGKRGDLEEVPEDEDQLPVKPVFIEGECSVLPSDLQGEERG